MTVILILFLGLCWGSLLNVIAYCSTHGETIWRPRSHCPHCLQNVDWYDLIPIISWFVLRGSCRHCRTSISPLYPFIELIGASAALLLWYAVQPAYIPLYFIFFSALIITIRTDAETLTIDRLYTLALIPFALLASTMKLLPITPLESLLGLSLGYGILALVRIFSRIMRKHDGIGQGDLELLATIGAFTGPIGCWFALLIGTICGAFYGLLFSSRQGLSAQTMIPLGAFLALAALLTTPFIATLSHILLC
ncbi:MAG: prepilin peptidase [Candidatus Babeliaceae bacterium]|nr:prepilin peptidase [Candidatus Babeliaceae bacterium]